MQKIMGFTEAGNTTLAITGAAGTITRKVQGSFPSCTVTVFIANTVTLATIYADNALTSKANPFTASASGTWFFYAPNGTYDVQFSGGGIAAPFTLGALGGVDENIIWADVTASPYFATGNGTMDDTAAIQAAFTALAATGGTVYFPPGTYRISSPLTIGSNLVLQGSDSGVSIIQASAIIARMIDGRNKTGVTVERLKLDGNNAGAIGLDLSNSTIGESTTNRVYQTRVYFTTSIGINMNNNGDSVLEDVVFDVTSGVSVQWDDVGGNINMTRVAAANAHDSNHLAFQTCVLVDCTLRDIHITFGSEQLRSVGGYYYNTNGKAVFTVDPGFNLRQADFIGTRFEITDVVGAPTGKYAIDGKFATGLFMTNPKFGNAQNAAGTLVFGPNFGSAAGVSAGLWIYGGTVGTEVVNTPVFNPSNVVASVYQFVSGAGVTLDYASVGSVGNDGTAGLIVTPPAANRTASIIRGLGSQTGFLLDLQKSDGTSYGNISAIGQFTIPFVVVTQSVITEPPIRFNSNNAATYPTAGTTQGSIGNNFSAGAGEVNFWNDQTSATTSFNFSQLTGVGTRKSILDLLPTGNMTLSGDFRAASIAGIPATYANRPSSPGEGLMFVVTDSTVTSGTVSAGGGTHHNLVIYTGTLWTVVLNIS